MTTTAQTYCRECGEEAVGRTEACCVARVREVLASMYRIGSAAIADRDRYRAALQEIADKRDVLGWWYAGGIALEALAGPT